jgi:hypothetical protein
LKKAEKRGTKEAEKWQKLLAGKRNEHDDKKPFDEAAYIMDNDISWAWALQDEMPPPSAIVGRRDTVSGLSTLVKMCLRLTMRMPTF